MLPDPEQLQARHPVVRWLLIGVGWLSFVLGVIGLALPVLPTTPFLLLSAACFVRSSPRFYHWLINHRLFGSYLRYYLAGMGIPRRVKRRVIFILWAMMLVSALLIVPWRWLSALLLLIALGVSIYIARQPEPDESLPPPRLATGERSESI